VSFKHTIIACFSYFLALLSKENGITFLAIFPMTYFVIKKGSILRSLKSVFPYFLVAMGYLLLRYKIVGMHFSKSHELMNAPYLLATGAQAFATKSYILLKYLYLLFVPYPLTYDYSFNQIPYIDGSDFRAWLSILIYVGLLIYALLNLKNRSIVSYAILFYIITISIVSNFIFDVGATMGERFLFQPSFAFSLVAGIFLHKMYMKSDKKIRRFVFIPLLSVLIIAASGLSIARNMDWKNDYTLFMHDVKSSPNSAKVYVYAGVVMVKSADNETDSIRKHKVLRESILSFEKALKIYPDFTDAYLNMGVAYSNLNEKQKALESWEKANTLSPGHFIAIANLKYLSDWFLRRAVFLFDQKDFDGAIKNTETSIRANPQNSLAWYNLGGYWMMKGDKEKARQFWTKTLEIDPNYTDAKIWLEKIRD
jgi:tetratricopeptide (TPR) repeat protein